jgi:hypothetical protein
MTVWAWIEVGVAGLLTLSLLIGLAIARVLGTVGTEIAQLLETEAWTSAPLTRDTEGLVKAPGSGLGHVQRKRRSRSSRI